jgi:hypothetical protein
MKKYLPYPFGILFSPQVRSGRVVLWHITLAVFLYGQILYCILYINQNFIAEVQIPYFLMVSLFFSHLGNPSSSRKWLFFYAFAFSFGILYFSYGMRSVMMIVMYIIGSHWLSDPIIALGGIINFLTCFITYVHGGLSLRL